MRNGMTNVPKRLMNVPPKRIHAAGGRALTLSRNDCKGDDYHAEFAARRRKAVYANSKRTRSRRWPRIAPISAPVLFQMMSLMSATRFGRKYCHPSIAQVKVTPRRTVRTYVCNVGRLIV